MGVGPVRWRPLAPGRSDAPLTSRHARSPTSSSTSTSSPGPFDLLLTLVLREEVDLLEVDLADIVLAYIDHLEAAGRARPRGRDRVPGADRGAAGAEVAADAARRGARSCSSWSPGEAAEELLARLLERAPLPRRRRRTCSERLAPSSRATASARRRCRRRCGARRCRTPQAVYDPARARRGDRRPAARCRRRSTSATWRSRGHGGRAPGAAARAAAPRHASASTRRSRGADRVTVAVTLFALLELYKQGEATWSQDEPFGEITIERADAGRLRAAGPVCSGWPDEPPSVPSASARSSRCCSSAPSRSRAAALADATGVELDEASTALERLRGALRAEPAGWCCASWPAANAVHPPRRRGRRPAAAGQPRTPPLTPAQAETLAIVAYLQPVSRPEIARIRGVSAESAAATLLERGMIEEAGRSQFGAVLYRTTDAVPAAVRAELAGRAARRQRVRPRRPSSSSELRERLLRAGEARAGGAEAVREAVPRSNGSEPRRATRTRDRPRTSRLSRERGAAG